MTTEDKAREYAWSVLEQRCERVKCTETSCKPYEHKQDELHTRCRSRYHCLRDGYIAGHNSCDAEVDELKAEIKELKERLDWIDVEDKLPPHMTTVLCKYTFALLDGVSQVGYMCAFNMGSHWYDENMNRLEDIVITQWRKI